MTIPTSYLDAWPGGSSGRAFGRGGSSPAPFDALPDDDFAGPDGSTEPRP